MIRTIAFGSIVGVAMLVSACTAQAERRQPASAPQSAPAPSPDDALINARKAWSQNDLKQLDLAARNIPNVDVLPVQGINVYDILRREKLVLTKAAVEALEARFK